MSNGVANFQITLTESPGVLERLLSIVRRRGFELKYVLIDVIEDGFLAKLRLENTPRGSHSFENLSSHLENQLDVLSVGFAIDNDLGGHKVVHPVFPGFQSRKQYVRV